MADRANLSSNTQHRPIYGSTTVPRSNNINHPIASLLRQLQSHAPNYSGPLFGFLAFAISGGILLLLTGITVTASVLVFIAFLPIIIISSPIWIPLFLIVTGFLSLAGFLFGTAAVVSWTYRYFKGMHPVGSDQVDYARSRIYDTAVHVKDYAGGYLHGNGSDLPGDGDNSDCYTFSTPLSSRGSTKHDAISVESYGGDRRVRIKSESPVFIDLDQYNNDEDDDDLRILSFPPVLEKGQSSKGKPLRPSNFYCEICVESKPVNESFPINGCAHSYCNDCVSKYIAAKLQDNLLSIDCPVSGCSGRLEPYQCRLILPREVFDRWGDALCEAVVMRSKRFYCPYQDCSALVFLDEKEEGKMKESECPHCNRMVCVACETKWHPENERGRDDILLKKMAESNKWRRCPSCKSYIEKSHGCSYMTCRCGLAFCYDCGTLAKDHSHYCSNYRH